jgi:hypothetical protein
MYIRVFFCESDHVFDYRGLFSLRSTKTHRVYHRHRCRNTREWPLYREKND